MAFSVAPGERSECLTVNGAAACNSKWQIAGEEHNSLDRSVDLAGPGVYRATATVRLQPDGAVDALLDAHSPITAIATSTNSSDPRERPGAAVDGNPATGWVAAASDKHPDLHLILPRRTRVRGFRLLPIEGAPTSFPMNVLIGVHGHLLTRRVPADGVVRFRRQVRIRSLSIEVTRTTARVSTSSVDGTQTFLPVGIGEVRLLGRRAPKPVPARLLTISCRRGPVVNVDGIPVTMSVHGSMTAALQGLPLTATPCGSGDKPLHLRTGTNRFILPASLLVRPQSLRLARNGASPATNLPSVTPRVTHWGATNRTVDVSAPQASLLIVHENQNAGWRATVNGTTLQATTVDGWQQAWELPAGTVGAVHLVYTPQRTVAIGLIVGAVAALLLVGIALWRRPTRGQSLPAVAEGTTATVLAGVIVVVTLVALGSAVGLAVAAVLLLVLRYAGRARWWHPAWLTCSALVLVAAAEFIAPATSSHPWAGSVGVQTLCLVAVGIVLAEGLRARRPAPRLREPAQQRPLD